MKRIHQTQQEGFAAIIVAMAIMIFVSLMALGFAFLARENHIQNQNRLLSTQAFYSAESGVNDAVQYLKSQLAGGSLPAPKTDCADLPNHTSAVGSLNAEVKYTCVMYDTAPTSLEGTANSSQSEVVLVQAQPVAGVPSNLASVTISWEDSQNSTQFANNPAHGLPQASFPAGNANNLATGTGILRATLVPIIKNASGNFTRDSLTTGTQTLFLYPNSGAPGPVVTQHFLGSATISDNNQGVFVNGNCNTNKSPDNCKVTIDQLDNLGATDTFYIRLRTLYRLGSNYVISATTTSGQPAHLINDQVMIDSTGKADNVLRRIQVRVPLSADTAKPEFAIESLDSLCKRMQVWPTGENTDWPTHGTPDTCNPFN